MRWIGLLMVLSACPGETNDDSDADSQDVESDTSADTSEDGLEQSALCAAYLDCVQEVAEDDVDALLGEYGVDGSCWQSDDEADRCTAICESELETFYVADPGSTECNPRVVGRRPADVADALERVVYVQLDDRGTEQCGYPVVYQGLRWMGAQERMEVVDGLLPDPQTYACERSGDAINCSSVTRMYTDGFLDHTSASTPSVTYDPDSGVLSVSFAFDESFVGANGEGISGSCRQTLSGQFVF